MSEPRPESRDFGYHALIDDKPNNTTSEQTDDCSQGDRGTRITGTDTSDENECLQPLTKHGDERNVKHGILLGPDLQTLHEGQVLGAVLEGHGLRDLKTPLCLKL